MGGTRDFRQAQHKRSADAAEARTLTLACGCGTTESPTLSKPDKWWCCGAWQKAKR